MKKQEEVQGVQQALVIWKEVLALQLPAYNNANQNPIEIEAKNILLSFLQLLRLRHAPHIQPE